MATLSPNWKPIAGMVKLKKKKNRSISRDNDTVETSAGKQMAKQHATAVGSGQKRRNPFNQQNNSRKRKKDQQEAFLHTATPVRTDKKNPENSESFFSSLEKASDALVREDVDNQLPSVQEMIQKESINEKEAAEANEDSQVWHTYFPADWCLCTRLRFISKESFSWCSPLRTAEQVAGLLAYTRTELQSAESHSSPICRKEKADKTAFSQHCHYWQHPCLPWMKLFPRYIADPSNSNVGANKLDEDMQKSLYQHWAESFTSAFNMVKGGASPFVYMCAHQMTVLFRSARKNQQSSVEALVTPTTKGFREALKNEGVEFSMPLCVGKPTNLAELDELKENEEDTKQSLKARVDELDEQEDEEESENHSDWITTMGLNHSDFPELQARKLKPQENVYRDIDKRAESVVHVTGPDTQALFNYLLNCKSCIALTGRHAGVPPTLLSPVAFKGATLQTLQVRQGTLRTEDTSQKEYSLEVSGPILPNTVYELLRLFQRTQDEFSVSFSNHDTTSPFNCNIEPNTDSRVADDCVIEGTHQWLHQPSSLNKHSIKVLLCKDNKFTWTL